MNGRDGRKQYCWVSSGCVASEVVYLMLKAKPALLIIRVINHQSANHQSSSFNSSILLTCQFCGSQFHPPRVEEPRENMLSSLKF